MLPGQEGPSSPGRFRDRPPQSPAPTAAPGRTRRKLVGVAGEHHHAASDAAHLAQASDRGRPVMNGGKSHRDVEGLVVEWKAPRGGSYARRRSCGTLRTHDRRRLYRGDVTVGGLVGAGASPSVQHGPCIAECSPDLCGNPRLGPPGHGVRGSRWCQTTARWTSSRTLRHDRQGSSESRTLSLGRPGSGAIPLNADCGACQPSGSRLRHGGTRSCPFAAIAAARSPQW